MPLSLVQIGTSVVVDKIVGDEGACKRLAEMGFNKGVGVKVIKNSKGSLIIGLGDSRIALGRGIAHKIMVTEA